MRFMVTRSSGSTGRTGGNKPPCDGAVLDGVDGYRNPRYVVDISDLDALLQFARDNGNLLVVNTKPYRSTMPEIEIYDGYRE